MLRGSENPRVQDRKQLIPGVPFLWRELSVGKKPPTRIWDKKKGSRYEVQGFLARDRCHGRCCFCTGRVGRRHAAQGRADGRAARGVLGGLLYRSARRCELA